MATLPTVANPYYVPAPDLPPNLFTAFWASTLRLRMPLAEQVLAQRLAALTPKDRSEEIVALLKEESDFLQSLEATKREGRKAELGFRGNVLGALARFASAKITAQERAAESQFEAGARERLAAGATDDQTVILERMAVDAANAVARGKPAEFDAAVRQGLQELGDTNPTEAQRGTLSRQVSGIVGTGSAKFEGDPVLGQLGGLVLSTVGAPRERPPEPEFPGFGGGEAERALFAAASRFTGLPPTASVEEQLKALGVSTAELEAGGAVEAPIGDEAQKFLESLRGQRETFQEEQGTVPEAGDLFRPIGARPAGLDFTGTFQRLSAAPAGTGTGAPVVEFQQGVRRAQEEGRPSPRRLRRAITGVQEETAEAKEIQRAEAGATVGTTPVARIFTGEPGPGERGAGEAERFRALLEGPEALAEDELTELRGLLPDDELLESIEEERRRRAAGVR